MARLAPTGLAETIRQAASREARGKAPKDGETYRRHLLDLGRRLAGDTADLVGEALRCTGGEASGGISGTPLHPADLGTDHAMQQVNLAMLENDQRLLGEIAAALARLDQGQFGRCEVCTRVIPGPRLDALPYARYCVDCARASERA